jgi:hypothetical protein
LLVGCRSRGHARILLCRRHAGRHGSLLESGQARVRAPAPRRLTDNANLLTENANLHD